MSGRRDKESITKKSKDEKEEGGGVEEEEERIKMRFHIHKQ